MPVDDFQNIMSVRVSQCVCVCGGGGWGVGGRGEVGGGGEGGVWFVCFGHS